MRLTHTQYQWPFLLQTYNASGRLWANDRLVRPFSSSCITVYKDAGERRIIRLDVVNHLVRL